MEGAIEGCRVESETEAEYKLEEGSGEQSGADLEQGLEYGPRVESGMGSG